MPASGTFGFGLELADAMDLNVLGGISLKGTTREARFGNPTPRIAECTAGMINSVGLQNPGIGVLVSEKAPALRRIYDGVIIANISGYSVEEYAYNCGLADTCPAIDILEVDTRPTPGRSPLRRRRCSGRPPAIRRRSRTGHIR